MQSPSLFLLTFLLLPLAAFSYERPDNLYYYMGEVDRVIDGNSLQIHIDLGFGVWKRWETVSLHGIQAPPQTGETRDAGIAAKDFLRSKLEDQEAVLLQTFKDKKVEKGFAVIISIWNEEKEAWESVNDMMVAAGHATKVED